MAHKGGLYSQCHYCRRDAKRASHERNREHNNARTDKWVNANREYVRQKNREYVATHGEENRAKAAAWAKANPERKKAWAKADYWNNREENQRKAREYYQNNKTRAYLYGRQWRIDNRERHNKSNREWEKRHPEYMRAKASKRRAWKKSAAGGNYTAADVRIAYKSQKGKCWHCGKPVGKTYHVDHLIPLAKGGSNAANNIVISCVPCNLSKGGKLPQEWNGRLF